MSGIETTQTGNVPEDRSGTPDNLEALKKKQKTTRRKITTTCRHVGEMIQARLSRTTIKSVLDKARKHLVAASVINDDKADLLDDDNEQMERQQDHHLQ